MYIRTRQYMYVGELAEKRVIPGGRGLGDLPAWLAC